MKLPKGGWLVVADGAKFLVFENAGTPMNPDLRVRAMREWAHPPTRETGTDKPGRYPGPGGRREAVADTDWHRIDKVRFATTLAETLDAAVEHAAFSALVLVADPRTLGTLRQKLTARVRVRLALEIPADWTSLSVKDIERHLAKAGEAPAHS